jgi:tetratricopeptide (TPR) repeat protein
MFNGLGYLLIFGREFVVRYLVHADFWVRRLAGDGVGSGRVMAMATLYTVPTAVLCWLTASGLKRNRWWRFAAGVLLLAGFPWLTIAGCVGLYGLFAMPAEAARSAGVAPAGRSTDYWRAKRQSRVQPVFQVVLWFFAFFIQAGFAVYAHRAGMPAWNPGVKWWLWLFPFLLLNTALHEAGHAIVAWAVGFRVRVFSAGPFTYWRGRSASRFAVDWARLLQGGYMGAVPVDDRNLRWNQIAVIAAGPATNLLVCLISLDAFFALPGTVWQAWWCVPAVCAIASGVMTIGNLVPAGYSDGTMLFQLIFQTTAGRLLLENYRIHRLDEESSACRDRADFRKVIELKEEMLRLALAFGNRNAWMIAACHQDLGSACVAIDEWAIGEHHYRKSLEFETEVAATPMLAANLWCGLQLTAMRRYDAEEARRAYEKAIAILESQKQTRGAADGPATTFGMLAQAHERTGAFEQALAAVQRGLKALPAGPASMLSRAHLLRCYAMSRLGANDAADGLAAAQAAGDALRSADIPEGRRNLAWERLSDFGAALWRLGAASMGLEYVREGIQHLEAGGAGFVATRFRIKLANMLRQDGRLKEAAAVLPAEEDVAAELRRAFLEARAELYLAHGRGEAAVADARELVERWQSLGAAAPTEIASAQALLAKALLATGDADAADALAATAAEVLGPRQHPDAASCAITCALASRPTMPGEQEHRVAAGMWLIDTAVLVSAAERARLREVEMARVRRLAVSV